MIKDPISLRRVQIDKELSKIHELKEKKSHRDFKTPEAFRSWQDRQRRRLEELYSEGAVLEYPEGYNEIPLAIAASELGIRLNEILEVVREGLVALAHEGEYPLAARITRDELARLIDLGATDLLAEARQGASEIFEAVSHEIASGNVEALRRGYERIERLDSCINPFALALEIAIEFLSDNPQAVNELLAFIGRLENADLSATLDPLKKVAALLPLRSHLMEAARERILRTANGDKEVPFRDAFSTFVGSQRRSQMSENQRRALFLADVVMHVIEKYKLTKSMLSTRSFIREPLREELERVIANAVYTALHAESSYSESATSRLFIDKYVELSPKWSKPPEKIDI